MDSCYLQPICILAAVVVIIALAALRTKRRVRREQAEEEKRMQLEKEQARARMVQFELLIMRLNSSDFYSSGFNRDLKFLQSDNKDESDVAAAEARVLAFKLGRRSGQAFEHLMDGLSEILLIEDRDELFPGVVEAIAERFKRGDARAFNALTSLLEPFPVKPDLYFARDDEKPKEAIRLRLAELAAAKLGEIGDPRAIEALTGQLVVQPWYSELHKQAAEALERMIKPGDKHAAEELWKSVTGQALINSQVTALGRFGDARAVESLVAHARHWSGEECDKEWNDGVPCYTCGSSAAVDALEKILERDAANASDEALRSALELDGLTSQTHPNSEHDSYRDRRDPISCATIHRLAREELERRGLEL